MTKRRFSPLARFLGLGFLGALVGLLLAESSLRPKDSTRRLWRASRQQGRSLYQFLHGYAYSRWPYAYIGSAIGERWELRWLRALFAPFLVRALSPMRWVAEYHGKALPLQTARRLLSVHEAVQMTVPQEAIPFENARDLVLQHPQHITVLDCPCRMSRRNPCYPLDVCLIVGEPFASFIVEHHPDRARSITSEEAICILEEEARRGHGHYAFFKEAMLDRFYAICNCCSCCCGAVSATRHGTPMIISSGYVCRVDTAICRKCGTCVRTCAFGAIVLNQAEGDDASGGVGAPVVDPDLCVGCGACVQTCTTGALSLGMDESKPWPLELPAQAALS
jgi:ferredoxin